jgi:hypothetical protein
MGLSAPIRRLPRRKYDGQAIAILQRDINAGSLHRWTSRRHAKGSQTILDRLEGCVRRIHRFGNRESLGANGKAGTGCPTGGYPPESA